jgi:hypothetical protein
MVLLAGCTRNVKDRQVYDRCFVKRECDSDTTEDCFRLEGETTSTLRICSITCASDADCPASGRCSPLYIPVDGGTTDPICIQTCAQDTECQRGGFVCRSGLCLPP